MIKLFAFLLVCIFLVGCAKVLVKPKQSATEAKPKLFEPVVILNLEPQDTKVKTLYEVFSWGREALAEYFYYAEIEKSALKPDGTGDLSKSAYFAEVTVSFESDVMDVAKSDLHTISLSELDAFSLDQKIGGITMGNANPLQVISLLNSPEYFSAISIEKNGFQTFNTNGFSKSVYFRSIKVEQDRVTEIKVWSKSNETNIGWLHSRFINLVNSYKNIPMNRFLGAIRE